MTMTWFSKKVEKRESGIEGIGLWCVVPITRGEVVVVKGGHVFDRAKRDELAETLGPAETSCLSAVAASGFRTPITTKFPGTAHKARTVSSPRPDVAPVTMKSRLDMAFLVLEWLIATYANAKVSSNSHSGAHRHAAASICRFKEAPVPEAIGGNG